MVYIYSVVTEVATFFELWTVATEYKCQLIMRNLISKIKKIAADNPYGFTVDLDLKPIAHQSGFLVSLPETQNSFSDEDLERVIRIAKRKKTFIGGWFNPQNGKYYYDATIWEKDLEMALKIAKDNLQIEIYDLKNHRSVRVK